MYSIWFNHVAERRNLFMNKEAADLNPGISVKPEMKTKIMSDEEIEQIHQATLTVLQEAGVKFPSQKALHILNRKKR